MPFCMDRIGSTLEMNRAENEAMPLQDQMYSTRLAPEISGVTFQDMLWPLWQRSGRPVLQGHYGRTWPNVNMIGG